MTCVNCQNKIEKKLRGMVGVIRAKVSYSAGTADVTYNARVISLRKLSAAIESLGYEVLSDAERQVPNTSRAVGMLIIAAALFLLIRQYGVLNLFAPGLLAETGMGYGVLFLIGLITSVHCVAMCGGINLSQCIAHGKRRENESSVGAFRPALFYNLGRVVSYTVIGFGVGALGSVVTFSGAMQGGLKLIAGVFMILMGANMLGSFRWLRKLTPRLPRIFARKIDEKKGSSKSPLIVGLLNGLMPCGPLQAMQIYALSTGNPLAGALSMFIFSAGTVPLMFGLGVLSAALSRKFTRRVMTIGAVLVVVLGLSMFSQGWSLADITLPNRTIRVASEHSNTSDTRIENGTQIVNSTLSSGKYPNITVQAGTPVKWLIDAPDGTVNGCNNRMLINEYGIEHSFKTGENVIEFTPREVGTVRYSCWMGMIRGTISVVEAPDETAQEADKLEG
jgi:sulfite exporter TauE/SafE/copper chaperone CopZ